MNISQILKLYYFYKIFSIRLHLDGNAFNRLMLRCKASFEALHPSYPLSLLIVPAANQIAFTTTVRLQQAMPAIAAQLALMSSSSPIPTRLARSASTPPCAARPKKLAPQPVASEQVVLDDVALICELDEQWSFGGSKAHRHWLWYVFDTKRKRVVAYTFGPLGYCAALAISDSFITSDDWGSYAREIPADQHLTGKIYTQRNESNNLTLRIRIRLKRLARKTICFSRSVELHNKVIGAFIETCYFN